MKTNVFRDQSLQISENPDSLLKQKDNYKNLYSKDTSRHFSPVKKDSSFVNAAELMVLKPTNCNPMQSQEYHMDLKKEFNYKKNANSEYIKAVALYANITKKNNPKDVKMDRK